MNSRSEEEYTPLSLLRLARGWVYNRRWQGGETTEMLTPSTSFVAGFGLVTPWALSLALCLPINAQRPASGTFDGETHDCHVYAVDLIAAERLTREGLSRPNPTPEEIKKATKDIDLTLGEFKAKVREEIATTNSYKFPGTSLIVTATVFYTDESMSGSESMWQGLAIGKSSVQNAILTPGAAVTEVNYDPYTFKVLTKQRIQANGKLWVVGLQCQTMTDEEHRKLVENTPPPK